MPSSGVAALCLRSPYPELSPPEQVPLLPLLCLGALSWEEALRHTCLHIQAPTPQPADLTCLRFHSFFCQSGTIILFSDSHSEDGKRGWAGSYPPAYSGTFPSVQVCEQDPVVHICAEMQ